jgi:DNA sulfur modification protein DndD
MPEINDSSGMPLTNLNTSNYKLVKFAAIMAIVSAKNSQGFESLYSLISDAPTAFMGENYIIGFCRELSKVYRQSLIMSYEFYKNESLRKELLTNPNIKIGKVYLVTPNTSEQEERENRNNLSTNIQLLN